MNILGPNLRRGQARAEKSHLDLHRGESEETLTPLNLLGSRSAERKGSEEEEAPEPIEEGASDPMIMGLVARLPKPDAVWPLEDRAKWLRTAASIFALVYRTGEEEDGEQREESEIGIALGASGQAKARRPGDVSRSGGGSE